MFNHKSALVHTCTAVLALVSFSWQVHAQEAEIFIIQPQLLEEGGYDYSKANEAVTVFIGEAAQEEFEKLTLTDPQLRRMYYNDYFDENGELMESYTEVEIYEYYPTAGIVVQGGGHGYMSAFDVVNKRDADIPQFYAYSPSGNYRIKRTLRQYEIRYFIEELVDGEFVGMGELYFYCYAAGIYWHDENTIHYLAEVCGEDGKCEWAGFSSRVGYKYAEDENIEPLSRREIPVLGGEVMLELRKGVDFPCIGLQLSEFTVQ